MRVIRGTVTQLVADDTIRAIRTTGVDAEKFEAIIVRKIRLTLDPTQVAAWAAVCAIDLVVFGNAGHYHGRVTEVYKAAGTIPVFYEIVPVETRSYDDEFYIDLGTLTTGIQNAMDYEIFYDIVPGSEVEKVQSGY